ncbi:hypothetical protein ASPWEDRAFT_589758 [Aspergillus wentii DTO 134E9]|uniref:F-box domain-containing protein n=1 Tax=Aspergillus wentii DTO 134E9 TaxID=1073089 RepID=A0A1L9RCR8_ASPWE|nr:uncharacterized protein ASPWEDRAFT_589758 [Aspergillus wentii DTO 134E9]KAI9924295.1 hypothetical protein MW887_007245 [Aspergillus wentii]OJJ32716.1 hypothetical protein ASPWEDRAFT_589758 [Aspergillus wentii DTO 134E9]
MDLFSFLPTEILLKILHALPDFLALHRLLLASDRAARVFAHHGGYVLEDVLRAYPGTSFNLHRLFRSVALVRGHVRDGRTMQEFVAWMNANDGIALAGLKLPSPVLIEMVSVAANIQQLACACLRKLLNRIQHLQTRLEPTTPAPYPPEEPLSWMEEYRVHRALWYLQLFWDLHVKFDAAQPSRISEYYETVGSSYCWIEEEILCMACCISSMGTESAAPSDIIPLPSARSLPIHAEWTMAPVPDNSGRDLFKSRPPSWANLGGSAYYIWSLRTDINPQTEDERHVTAFLSLRKLGIWFWDRERIEMLGMDIQERSEESGEVTPEERARVRQRWWDVARIGHAMD